jgi:hypothetical protein
MGNASDKVVDKIRIYILYVITSFTENRAVDNVEKYGTARQATDDNIPHAHYMLDS